MTEERVTSNTNSVRTRTKTSADPSGNPIFATTTSDIAAGGAKTSFTSPAYAEDEWKLLDTLTINPGLRFDAVNGYTTGSQVSPRLSVVWNATPSTTVHAGYASYFTPPPQELVSTQNLALFAGTSAAPAVTTNPARSRTSARNISIWA